MTVAMVMEFADWLGLGRISILRTRCGIGSFPTMLSESEGGVGPHNKLGCCHQKGEWTQDRENPRPVNQEPVPIPNAPVSHLIP